MVTSASRSIILRPSHKPAWLPVLLVIAVLSSVAILLAHIRARHPIASIIDLETGCRFAFTIAPEWTPKAKPKPGFSEKHDDLAFSLAKPSPFQVWFEAHLLHRNPLPFKQPLFENELSVCSGDKIRSGKRSPFRNFNLQDNYPSPRHPDFVEPPGTTMMEETHLLVSGQPALWRLTRADVYVSLIGAGRRGKPSYTFYTYTLVVKVKDKDAWFAVVGTGDEDHRFQMRDEVRAIGDSLRIENVQLK